MSCTHNTSIKSSSLNPKRHHDISVTAAEHDVLCYAEYTLLYNVICPLYFKDTNMMCNILTRGCLP